MIDVEPLVDSDEVIVCEVVSDEVADLEFVIDVDFVGMCVNDFDAESGSLTDCVSDVDGETLAVAVFDVDVDFVKVWESEDDSEMETVSESESVPEIEAVRENEKDFVLVALVDLDEVSLATPLTVSEMLDELVRVSGRVLVAVSGWDALTLAESLGVIDEELVSSEETVEDFGVVAVAVWRSVAETEWDFVPLDFVCDLVAEAVIEADVVTVLSVVMEPVFFDTVLVNELSLELESDAERSEVMVRVGCV